MSRYLLHTDDLERKYGPIRAVVTRHDPAAREGERIRKAKLIDGSGIMRTYALTFLNSDGRDEELNSIDEDIRNLGLIGQTFRKNQYEIIRTSICSFNVHLPFWMKNEFRVSCDIAHTAVLNLGVKKTGKAPFLYGTLVEIYSPDFYTPRVDGESVDDAVLKQTSGSVLHHKIVELLEDDGI